MAGIKFVHREEKQIKLKGKPKVPFNKSKKLSTMDGSESLFYIETATAFSMKLDSFVDFTQKHPQYGNYALITVPIERVEK